MFTPETYYIEYTELSDGESTTTDPDVTIQYPVINTNFSAVDVEYTFVVNGLEASSVYSVIVVAANSIGETRPLEYTSFETRDEGVKYEKVLFSYYMCAKSVMHIYSIQPNHN